MSFDEHSRYAEHANRLQARATQEHLRWLATMSPRDRKRVGQLGLDHPSHDDCEVAGHSPYQPADAADSAAARTEIDFAALLDSEQDTLADELGISPEAAGRVLKWAERELRAAVVKHEAFLLQLVVGGLLSAKNPKLSCAGLAFAAQLGTLNGLGSQSAYAQANGISRSAISKVHRFWKRMLRLRTGPHGKSEKACQHYSEIGKASHWRHRKATASELLKRLSK